MGALATSLGRTINLRWKGGEGEDAYLGDLIQREQRERPKGERERGIVKGDGRWKARGGRNCCVDEDSGESIKASGGN